MLKTALENLYIGIVEKITRPRIRPLEQRIKHLDNCIRLLFEPFFNKATFDKHGVSLDLDGHFGRVFAAFFLESLNGNNGRTAYAPNYLEFQVSSKECPKGIVVCVQRKEGKTPNELKREAELEAQKEKTKAGILRTAIKKHKEEKHKKRDAHIYSHDLDLWDIIR